MYYAAYFLAIIEKVASAPYLKLLDILNIDSIFKLKMLSMLSISRSLR